jgi:hypothetical protein
MPQAQSSNQQDYGTASTGRFILVAALFVLIATSLTVANYRFQLQSSGGSDMIPRWIGTRLLLLEGVNPYSAEATEAIQRFYYGHPAKPDQDQVLFVYPLYTIYLFAPFAAFQDYSLARALYMTAMELSLILLTVVSLRLARWWPEPLVLVGLLLFAVLWYHSIRPLINGNAAIFSALFIAASLLLIRQRRDFVGGFLLTFASIKPQMVILLIPLALLWALSVRRRSLLIGIAGSFALLVGTTMLVVPTWPADNLGQILAYPGYTLSGTPTEIFLERVPEAGRLLGSLFTVFMSIILLWSWQRTWGAGFETFYWSACMTLALTNLIGVRTTTTNFIALLPGLILILAEWQRRWPRYGRWYAIAAVLLLFFGLWYLFLSTRSGRMQNPILFFPLPIFTIVALLAIMPHRPGRRQVPPPPTEIPFST